MRTMKIALKSYGYKYTSETEPCERNLVFTLKRQKTSGILFLVTPSPFFSLRSCFNGVSNIFFHFPAWILAKTRILFL